MNIPVFVDKVFQEYISIKKTTTIRSIKKFLEKYKGDIKFFVDNKTTSKFFDTDKYDKYNLSSIWNQLKQPSIEISSEDQFKYTSKDMVFKIMDEMDDFTLLNFCKINNQRDTEGVLYCNNVRFWENRLLRKYPLLNFKEKNQSWKEFYLEMVYYLSKLEEDFGIPYIPNNNPKEFYKLYKDNEFYNIFNEAMRWAVIGGHVDIVKLMIQKGATGFNRSMFRVARRGHMDIVKLMIEKGATDFNGAMYEAAHGGHMDIVKLMIQKGATDFNFAMSKAAEGGHMDIVQLMIQKGATNFDGTMRGAARGGHMDIVELMIEKGATNFDWAMSGAAIGGHMDIMELMIEKGATDFNGAMYYAAKGGHMEIVKYMIDKGADDFNRAMSGAAERRHTDIVDYLKSLYLKSFNENWSRK